LLNELLQEFSGFHHLVIPLYTHILTAIGFTYGGSSTLHIYTQTIHRTQLTQTIHRITQLIYLFLFVNVIRTSPVFRGYVAPHLWFVIFTSILLTGPRLLLLSSTVENGYDLGSTGRISGLRANRAEKKISITASLTSEYLSPRISRPTGCNLLSAKFM